MHSTVKWIHTPPRWVLRVWYFGCGLHRHVLITIKAITEPISYFNWIPTCIHVQKVIEFHSSAVLYHAQAAFLRRLKRFVMASGLREARPEPKSMVLCWTDTCRARPPAPEVINMHVPPPWPSHCPLHRPHVLAPLSPLGTCYPSAILWGLELLALFQPDCSWRAADFEICLIKILTNCFPLPHKCTTSLY